MPPGIPENKGLGQSARREGWFGGAEDGGPWHPRRRAPAACGAGSPRPPGDSFTSVCPSPKSKGVGALEDIGGENRPKNPDSHIVFKNGKIRPRWVWRFTGLRVAGPGSRPHLQTGAGVPATFPGALPDARVEPRASRVPHAAESGSSDWASRVRLCSLGLLSQKVPRTVLETHTHSSCPERPEGQDEGASRRGA